MKRTLTIPPFALPDGSQPETLVIISLTDRDTGELAANIVSPNGRGVLGCVTIKVHERERTVSLWANEDLSGNSVYSVEVLNRGASVSRFRTWVAKGGDLSWTEFTEGVIQ